MVKHVILWILKDEYSEEEKKQIKQGIKEGDETVISAHQIRFLRRLVRDYQFRSSPPERTFEMWPQVLRGEKLYISAYKRQATVTINSIHIYEVNAIADKAIEILSSLPESSHLSVLRGCSILWCKGYAPMPYGASSITRVRKMRQNMRDMTG